jgi:nicotinic acid mononucleotide adenylyltransferase
MRMLDIAIDALPIETANQISVSDIEKTVCEELPNKNYVEGPQPSASTAAEVATPIVGTIDILAALKRQYPDVLFVPIMGTDAYVDVKAGKWKDSDALLTHYPILVINRSEGASGAVFYHQPEALNFLILKWQELPQGLTAVSSTGAREAVGECERQRHLPTESASELNDYIKEQGIYQQ